MKHVTDLLVVIPHAEVGKPREIKASWLSEYNKKLIYSEDCETDKGTDKLYDFRKILGNRQLIFPISQIYINICRTPERLNEAVPLFIRETPIYKPGKEPSKEFRYELLRKYSLPFYEKIRNIKKSLILNGHSMVTGHASLGDEKAADIDISEHREIGNKIIQCAPKELADFYAEELRKRLPNLKIRRNSSYTSIPIYDYICEHFGWDGKFKRNYEVPIIHQETNENLYIENNKINYKKLNILRTAFAESLYATRNHFLNSQRK